MNKIAFLLPNFSTGGVENVVLTIINGLVQRNIAVTLIVMQDVGPWRYRLDNRVKLVNLKCSKARFLFFYLGRFLHKEKLDVLYSAKDGMNIICAAAVRFFSPSTHIVIAQHNYFVLEDNGNHFINRFLLSRLMKLFYPLADKIIAVSSGIKSFLMEWKIPVSKISVIYNPIDIEGIKQKAEEPVALPDEYIVFVGRLSSVKNVFLALRAFAKLTDKYPKLQFLLLGEGALYEAIQKEIALPEYRGKVHLCGNIVNPYPYMKKAQLVLLPSLSEAWSMVVIESVVLGTKVVCTPAKGPIEILGRSYPYVTHSFDDADEYATMIQRAMENEYSYNIDLSLYTLECVLSKYLHVLS